MSLVYTTLLSLVPLLALSFSVLKGFGIHNQIEPMLRKLLEPLGPGGAELAGHIIGFVENMKVGVLGALGLAMLVYTVISLLQKIEMTLNFVWHVQRVRSFSQRFSQYLSVLLVGPILLFAAMGVAAALANHRVVQRLGEIAPLGVGLSVLGWLFPFLLLTAAFTFVFVYMPNTRVRVRPAAVGGVVAALLWHGVGWGFTTFIAGSTKYTAVYAGFAIVIVGMIWLYLAWLILLVGASLAFYVQHPAYCAVAARDPTLSIRGRETLALRLLACIVTGFRRGDSPSTAGELAAALCAPAKPVERLLGSLVSAGIVAETADIAPRYVPARSPEGVALKEILALVRGADGEPVLEAAGRAAAPAIDALVDRAEQGAALALSGLTWNDLGTDGHESGPREGPGG
jgi:membrane protein